MVSPPSWWAKLPKPPAVVVAAADPASVYHVAAVRRELRRVRFLAEHVPVSVQADVVAAAELLARASAQLVDELELRSGP